MQRSASTLRERGDDVMMPMVGYHEFTLCLDWFGPIICAGFILGTGCLGYVKR